MTLVLLLKPVFAGATQDLCNLTFAAASTDSLTLNGLTADSLSFSAASADDLGSPTSPC